MVVELVSVGTELLLGNIVNTNARYLSEKFAMLGLSVYYQTTVGDNRERMTEVIRTALSRADVVVLNGGLGPTEDDITKDVCAELMGAELKEDPEVRAHLEDWYRQRNKKDVPDSNWRQALVPEGAVVFHNTNGTAPGLALEKNGKTAILLPGPPNELYPMVENQVCPYFQKRQSEVIYSRMIKICGYGESKVEEMLLDLIDHQTNPTLATYAKTKEVHLRVTARAKSEEEAKKLLKPVIKEIKKRFGNAIYTTNEQDTLEAVVVDLLKKYGLTVTTAESCTGGLVAARITSVSGASEAFGYGAVTYCNEAKNKILGVKKETLDSFGAVSAETAAEMAAGVRKIMNAEIGVSVTGLAGPNGGEGKPVGLVYVAVNSDNYSEVTENHFSGDRISVRNQAADKALELALRAAKKLGE